MRGVSPGSTDPAKNVLPDMSDGPQIVATVISNPTRKNRGLPSHSGGVAFFGG
jgi:hypothetical protein